MSPADFVRQLASLAPNRDTLSSAGVPTADVPSLLRSYVCDPRGRHPDRPERDCAVALVEDWDASRVEIGMVQFLSDSSPCPAGIQIGVAEVDPLVVTSATGEIVVVDENEPAFVMSHAAENGGKLLDALLLAVTFLNKRLLFEIDYEDFPAAQAAARQCAVAAGGPKYENFYRDLLGADP